MVSIIGNRALEAAYSLDYDFAETNEYEILQIKKLLPKVIEERLTQRQRQCIELYYYENRTMKQAAETLGIDRTTVSRTLKRARERIKQSLKYYL